MSKEPLVNPEKQARVLRQNNEVKPEEKKAALPEKSTPAQAAMVSLQQTVGNRAAQRMLQRSGGEGAFALDDETAGKINSQRGGGQALDTGVNHPRSMVSRAADAESSVFRQAFTDDGARANRSGQSHDSVRPLVWSATVIKPAGDHSRLATQIRLINHRSERLSPRDAATVPSSLSHPTSVEPAAPVGFFESPSAPELLHSRARQLVHFNTRSRIQHHIVPPTTPLSSTHTHRIDRPTPAHQPDSRHQRPESPAHRRASIPHRASWWPAPV